MFSAILLSGGKGSRMMEQVPKQYLLLAGKPVIMHTLERIDRIESINEIVITCEEAYISAIQLMCSQYNLKTPVIFAARGESRQDSVYNALKLVTNEHVLLHEAARPFVGELEFRALIELPDENAIVGYPIPYTVVKGGEYIEGELNRDELINVQLPQKFNKNILCLAHEKAKSEGITFTEDSSMIFHYFKEKIKVVKGTSHNIKLTEPIDMITGEMIYKDYFSRRE